MKYKPRRRLRLEAGLTPFTPFALSDDGRLFAVGGDKNVRLWDLGAGEPKERAGPIPAGPVAAQAFSPDGTRLVLGTADGTLSLWDLTGPEPKEQVKVPTSIPPGLLTFTPDGKRLLLTHQGLYKVFTVEPGRLTEEASVTIAIPSGFGVWTQGLTPDGRTLVAMEESGLRFWDLTATPAKEVRPFDLAAYQRRYADNCFAGIHATADGRIVSAAGDGTCTVWDVGGATPRSTALRRTRGLQEWPVALSPDGRMLATCGREPDQNYSVSLWDMAAPRRAARQ